MDTQMLGRILLLVGAAIFILGGLFLLFGRTFESLPGTIQIVGQNVTCVIPVLASILLSIILTVVLNLIVRFINRP